MEQCKNVFMAAIFKYEYTMGKAVSIKCVDICSALHSAWSIWTLNFQYILVINEENNKEEEEKEKRPHYNKN